MRSLQNTSTIPLDVGGGGEPTGGHGGRKNAECRLYCSVNMLGYYTIPCRLLRKKKNKQSRGSALTRYNGEPRPSGY